MKVTGLTHQFSENRAGRPSRRLRAAWRDSLLLFRQFRAAVLLFAVVLVVGGIAYHQLSALAGEPVPSPAEAIYRVLSMMFLQAGGTFPSVWYLQVFYFVLPVLGIGIAAQGLAEFGVMFFNRRARSREWEMAIASTFDRHIILVGLGHLGYRVVHYLHRMGEEVVVMDINPAPELSEALRSLGIPVLEGDGRQESALLAANVLKAKAIQLTTQKDVANLQMAFKARSMNPAIQVVLRIFDDDFAMELNRQFGFRAMSATGMAAPVFAAAAAGVEMTGPLTVEGESISMARVRVGPGSALIGHTVTEVEENCRLSVVVLVRGSTRDVHPAGDLLLQEGDVLAVLGGPHQLNLFVQKLC
jgi:Trk K+ transport system NAD-binding subunit